MSRTPLSPGTRSVFLMLLSVLLFAANALAVRAVSLHFPMADGWSAALLRGAVGILVVLVMFGFGRGLRVAGLFDNRLVFLRGVAGAIGILIFYITVIKLGAARGVILNLTYPIWATLIAALWLKEHIRAAAVAWMFAGFAGLLLFLGGDGELLHPAPLDLLGLGGAVCAGWVVVIIRKLRHEEHPATVYASQAFYGMIFALPAAGGITRLPQTALWGLAAAAVIVSLAQLAMTRAFHDLSVSKGSAMQMLLPIITAVGGGVFFGETFHAIEYAGAALTILATWQIVRTPAAG
jgi:drug/metabolite transporter (DMT)-like permease